MTTERALIGTDAKGEPIVLATDGETIRYDVGSVSNQCGDIGICTHKDTPEPEIVYVGTLRKVEAHEIAELYAMTPPDSTVYPDDGREEIQPGDIT